MASIGRAIVEAITELRTSIDAIFGVVQTTGAFTTINAATQTVLNANVVAGSIIILVPTGTGSTTQQTGAGCLYVDRALNVAGVSFTIKTADGSSVAAGLQFVYTLTNPIA